MASDRIRARLSNVKATLIMQRAWMTRPVILRLVYFFVDPSSIAPPVSLGDVVPDHVDYEDQDEQGQPHGEDGLVF